MTSGAIGALSIARVFRGAPARFLALRLSQAVIVMLIVMVGGFILIHLAPGDLVDVLGGYSDMTAEQMAALRAQYGLDDPMMMQLGKYLLRLTTFDLGYSPKNAAPVLDVLLERLPTTALLVFFSVIVSLTLGTILGVIAARNAGTLVDMMISTAALLLYATPSFIIAIALILVFSVYFDLMPIAGLTTPGVDSRGFAHVLDVAKHLVMPVIALCTFYTAIYGRLSRAAMLDVMTLDFVRTARAKGLSEKRVVYGHALRNALMPLVTMAGLQMSSLIGGAVLVETVFGLPGMGRTAFDAIFERDVNLLLGVLFISSLGVVCINACIDLLYLLIDPRVELS